MIDIKEQTKRFKDHVATFTNYGNIKILDFQRPGHSEYRIRFLFQEDFYRLHISGALGELTASNFKNEITYVLSGWGIQEGFVVFAIKECELKDEDS